MNSDCKEGRHRWHGCRCSVCRARRGKGHDWSRDCGRCRLCGKTRAVQHDWTANSRWCARCLVPRPDRPITAGVVCSSHANGRAESPDDHELCPCCRTLVRVHHTPATSVLVCPRCMTTRRHTHSWVGCRCSGCPRTRHDWSRNCEACAVCGEVRSDRHSWQGCECAHCQTDRHVWTDDGGSCRLCHIARLDPTTPTSAPTPQGGDHRDGTYVSGDYGGDVWPRPWECRRRRRR